MKKKFALTVTVGAAALAVGGFLYFTRFHPLETADAATTTAAAPAPPPAPVVTAPVTQHDVPIYFTGVGTVIAYNTDVVRAQI